MRPIQTRGTTQICTFTSVYTVWWLFSLSWLPKLNQNCFLGFEVDPMLLEVKIYPFSISKRSKNQLSAWHSFENIMWTPYANRGVIGWNPMFRRQNFSSRVRKWRGRWHGDLITNSLVWLKMFVCAKTMAVSNPITDLTRKREENTKSILKCQVSLMQGHILFE